METETPPAAPPAPEEKKSLFETVVTATPVLLTVIATFMIGRSSGEMTNAQYFRAVASQNQSKVGDQWNFFQAKRIRGQILEGNSDLLMAQPRSPFTRDTLVNAAEELVRELEDAGGFIGEVKPSANSTPVEAEFTKELGKVSSELKKLLADAEKAAESTKAALHPPADGWKGQRQTLTSATVQAALDALQNKKADKKSTKKTESTESNDTSTEQADLLKDILADIRDRKHEEEIAPKVLKLNEETLKQAIKDADTKADDVYKRGKKIENVLEEFDALVARQTALAQAFGTLAQRLKPLLRKARGEAKTPGLWEAVYLQHTQLEQRAEVIRTLNATLQGDYKSARHAFGARRYEDDARSNQDAAFLYEVKVLLSSARSDKYLYRSKMYLLAMLVAQVGVTVATLAMALKRKSVFWLLAALTGLVAIGFGVYVYLDLWPMPSF